MRLYDKRPRVGSLRGDESQWIQCTELFPRCKFALFGARNNHVECFVGARKEESCVRDIKRLEPKDRWDKEMINNVIGDVRSSLQEMRESPVAADPDAKRRITMKSSPIPVVRHPDAISEETYNRHWL